MPTTPPYLLGKHLTLVTVAGVTIDANGVFSIGSAVSVRALIEELGHDVDFDTEDIAPVTSTQMNEVPLRSGNRVDLSTIALSNAANALHDLVDSFSACRLIWVQGTETFTGDYWLGSLRSGVRGRGKNVMTLSLLPIDNGGAQVVRS